MLAGIEGILAGCEKMMNQNQTNTTTTTKTTTTTTTKTPRHRKAHNKNSQASTEKNTKRRPRQTKAACKKSKTKNLKPVISDCLDEINKLLNSNPQEEAKKNTGSHSLPVVNLKDKHKALTALVASVPLEERGNSRGQRSQILRDIQTLGRGRASANGQGDWKFQGKQS